MSGRISGREVSDVLIDLEDIKRAGGPCIVYVAADQGVDSGSAPSQVEILPYHEDGDVWVPVRSELRLANRTGLHRPGSG